MLGLPRMCLQGKRGYYSLRRGRVGLVGVGGEDQGKAAVIRRAPGGLRMGDPAEQAGLMPELSRAKVLNWLLRVECLKQFTSGANCSWIIFPKCFMFCTCAQRQFYLVGALLSICHHE